MVKELGHFAKEDRGTDRKDLKRFSSSLAITTVRGHLRSLEGLESNSLRTPKTGEIVEQLELLLVGGNVKLREHFGELWAVAHEALSQEK